VPRLDTRNQAVVTIPKYAPEPHCGREFQPSSRHLSSVPVARSLCVRGAEAREIGYLGKGSYVFERILVMEEILELTRPQPSGIRVSDAVAWAREILARYEGELHTSNNAQGYH
jgi:hypothetical protein